MSNGMEAQNLLACCFKQEERGLERQDARAV